MGCCCSKDDWFLERSKEVEEEDHGKDTKQWMQSVKEPDPIPAVIMAKPTENLVAEYVYGYKSQESMKNIYYTADPNKIVYFIAAVGIVLNKPDNTQQIFGSGIAKKTKGHYHEITAIAISDNKQLVATGQKGTNPLILIWDVNCNYVSHIAQGKGTGAVKGLAFSKDGKHLCSLSDDNQYLATVWNIETSKSIAIYRFGADTVFDFAASRTQDLCFGFACKRGVNFYSVPEGVKSGLFNGNKLKDFISIGFLDSGEAVTGCTSGEIYVWSNHSCKLTKKGHQGPVQTINGYKDFCLTGGKFKILVYDSSWNIVRDIEVRSYVRALDMNENNIIVAGLRDGTIVEIDPKNKFTALMKGHAVGEIWGIALDSTSGKVVTVGDDNRILIWDIAIRKCVGEGDINKVAGENPDILKHSIQSQYSPNQQARAIDIHATRGHVAIGLNSGEFQVRHSIAKINFRIATKHDAKDLIQAIHYSPSGEFCAVASHDSTIFIYKTEDYSLASTCYGDDTFITAFDWSLDSYYLHAVCAYELIFLDIDSGKQIADGDVGLKNEKWAQWTIKYGWHVLGIFPEGKPYNHISCVFRNYSHKLVATGDKRGLVKIYRWPCLKGAESKDYQLHAGRISQLMFMNDDTRLFSTGGIDLAFAQWKVA